MTDTTVAIIGAGLAGLHAARLLHRAGVDFHLFEARDRVGGRILTVDDRGALAEDGFDLGPSWFWPQMHPVMAALVDELGLPFFQQHGTGDLVFERTLRESPQRVPGFAQEPTSMRLAGGTAALVRALMGPSDAIVALLWCRWWGVRPPSGCWCVQGGGVGGPEGGERLPGETAALARI